MSSPPSASASPTPGPAAPLPTSGARSGTPIWLRWLTSSEASVVLVLILLVIIMAVTGPVDRFLGPGNAENVSRSVGLQSILAIGVLLVILTGGIDLSLGSLVAFGGMLLAMTMTHLHEQRGMAPGPASAIGIVVVLLFSLGLGLLHASLVHFLRLPSFVVTLASMSILRSAAQLMNNASQITIQQFESVVYLGNGQIYLAGTPFGIPVPALVTLVLAAVVIAILGFTQIGRRVYSVGSNEEASRLSGVNVFRVRAFVYGGCSLLGGIAAILYAGYSNQGDPIAGQMFELNAISAAVIGGAVLTGGRGSVVGTVLGTLLLEVILSAIVFRVKEASLWQGVVVGGVLLSAVVLNQLRNLRIFQGGAKRGA